MTILLRVMLPSVSYWTKTKTGADVLDGGRRGGAELTSCAQGVVVHHRQCLFLARLRSANDDLSIVLVVVSVVLAIVVFVKFAHGLIIVVLVHFDNILVVELGVIVELDLVLSRGSARLAIIRVRHGDGVLLGVMLMLMLNAGQTRRCKTAYIPEVLG